MSQAGVHAVNAAAHPFPSLQTALESFRGNWELGTSTWTPLAPKNGMQALYRRALPCAGHERRSYAVLPLSLIHI